MDFGRPIFLRIVLCYCCYCRYCCCYLNNQQHYDINLLLPFRNISIFPCPMPYSFQIIRMLSLLQRIYRYSVKAQDLYTCCGPHISFQRNFITARRLLDSIKRCALQYWYKCTFACGLDFVGKQNLCTKCGVTYREKIRAQLFHIHTNSRVREEAKWDEDLASQLNSLGEF